MNENSNNDLADQFMNQMIQQNQNQRNQLQVNYPTIEKENIIENEEHKKDDQQNTNQTNRIKPGKLKFKKKK